MNETDFSAIRDFVLSQRLLDSERHGIIHWQQVERNGLLLATETGADTTVVRLFSLFHDSKRVTDEHDKTHGAQGAEFAKSCFEEHRLDITQEQFENYIMPASSTRRSPAQATPPSTPATMPTASTSDASESHSTPTRWLQPSGLVLQRHP